MPSSTNTPNTESSRLIAQMAELAGGLAHELRNPLSTMMVNLKLLAEDLKDAKAHPDDARRRALLKVDVLRREADRLQSLFDDFLHLAGPYPVERSEVDVNGVVTGLVEFFTPSAKDHGIEVISTLADDPVTCLADARLLRQALLNILINAQQAMPDGGILGIKTEAHEAEVVIAVTDTGVGVATEDRDRIMRPFFSTKATGNGLGLSITQRIMHEHGGSLGFESEPSGGTTFTLRLPRHPRRSDMAGA